MDPRKDSRDKVWTRRRWSKAGVLALSSVGMPLGLPLGLAGLGLRPAFSQNGGAAGALLELSLDPAQVYKDEMAELTAEVRLDPQGGGDVAAPQIIVDKAVKVRLAGSSSSQVTRIVNGQYSSEIRKRFRYTLSCDTGGRYVIDAQVKMGNTQLRARQRLTLQVHAKARKVPTTAQGDDVMVVPHLMPESKLYVGQAALFHLELWMRTADTPASVERPSFRDFITLDFDLPPRKVVSYNRRRYEVQSVYYRAVFPQRAGNLKIAGLELTMQPVSFGSIFSRRRKRAYRIKGPATTVQVLALPAKGQPRAFKSAHVGQFEMRTRVDRSDLKVQDALTLTVEIEGSGNLALLDPGVLPPIPGMRVYDPKRDEPEYRIQDHRLQGVIRWRYLMVADKAGTVTIPAMHLNYFDPIEERYARTQSEALVLDIKDATGNKVDPAGGNAPAGAAAGPKAPSDPSAAAPDSAGAGAAGAAGADSRKGDDALGSGRLDPNDVEPLMDVIATENLPRRAVARPSLTLARFYQLAFAAPAAVGISAGVAAILRNRAGDATQRQQRAERTALLASLEGLDLENPREAWSAVAKALQRIAILRAGERAAGSPRPELLSYLKKSGVDEKSVAEWGQWLDRGDAERFGASSSSSRDELAKARDFARQQLDAWGRG